MEAILFFFLAELLVQSQYFDALLIFSTYLCRLKSSPVGDGYISLHSGTRFWSFDILATLSD